MNKNGGHLILTSQLNVFLSCSAALERNHIRPPCVQGRRRAGCMATTTSLSLPLLLRAPVFFQMQSLTTRGLHGHEARMLQLTRFILLHSFHHIKQETAPVWSKTGTKERFQDSVFSDMYSACLFTSFICANAWHYDQKTKLESLGVLQVPPI